MAFCPIACPAGMHSLRHLQPPPPPVQVQMHPPEWSACGQPWLLWGPWHTALAGRRCRLGCTGTQSPLPARPSCRSSHCPACGAPLAGATQTPTAAAHGRRGGSGCRGGQRQRRRRLGCKMTTAGTAERQLWHEHGSSDESGSGGRTPAPSAEQHRQQWSSSVAASPAGHRCAPPARSPQRRPRLLGRPPGDGPPRRGPPPLHSAQAAAVVSWHELLTSRGLGGAEWCARQCCLPTPTTCNGCARCPASCHQRHPGTHARTLGGGFGAHRGKAQHPALKQDNVQGALHCGPARGRRTVPPPLVGALVVSACRGGMQNEGWHSGRAGVMGAPGQ